MRSSCRTVSGSSSERRSSRVLASVITAGLPLKAARALPAASAAASCAGDTSVAASQSARCSTVDTAW
jgi:hypothetical protein